MVNQIRFMFGGLQKAMIGVFSSPFLRSPVSPPHHVSASLVLRFLPAPLPRFSASPFLCTALATVLAASSAIAQEQAVSPPADLVAVSDLTLEGEIQGENITFTLTFQAYPQQKNAILPLIVGDVAYLDGKLPGNAELMREGDRYLLKFTSTRSRSVMCRFASRPVKDGEWRQTGFSIPASSVRKLSVICDRDDLEVRFPGALDVKRQKNKDGKMQVTAFLGVSGRFEVGWKPEIRKLESELAVTCEANTITTASVGALRVDTMFTYRIIQGALGKLTLQLPDVVNITQVYGEDIQDWHIEKGSNAAPRLVVALGRPKEDVYKLQVESEMALPKFPSKFNLPVLVPEGVLRTSGFLTIGTDSAIKLQVNKASGLTQIDQVSFPQMSLDSKKATARVVPTRCVYAYQFANMPYTLDISADDIFAAYTADDRLTLSFADNDLTFQAAVELDIKDAPAREIMIETDSDPEWTVTAITGQHVSEPDTDVRDEPADKTAGTIGKRVIYIPFKQAVSGTVLVNVRMEKTLKPDATSFGAPKFKVRDAKSERGYLVIAAEKGVRLKADKPTGLREVHTGSTQMNVEGAQQAYRFKEPEWSVSMSIERTNPSIYSEAFHLISLGQGVMYCSVAITYHISGAPIQEFKVRVPKEIEAIEFTGGDIEGWTRDSETCTVKLQRKIMGDYTLLATYDKQFSEQGANISIGGIETAGIGSEVGYMALASAASINLLPPAKLPESVIAIDDRAEIPTAYSAPIADPILRAYKYMGPQHQLQIKVVPYETEQLLGQIADYVRLNTELSKDGESKTVALYFVKNASRQYLEVAIPKSANLWSVKYVDDHDRKTDVPAQTKKSDSSLLIPVSRPPDPNTATRVEIVYAESLGKLGFWQSGFRHLRLPAPALLHNTDTVFASWTIEAPEGFAIADAGGNMSSDRDRKYAGFSGVVVKMWRLTKAVFDGPGGHTIRQALAGGIRGARSVEFTRTVTLSSMPPLSVKIEILPWWMGSASSAPAFTFFVILGIILTIKGLSGKQGLFALGLTVLAFGISESALGRSVLAALAMLVILVFLILFVTRVLKRIGGHWHRPKKELPPDDDLPPFEPVIGQTNQGGSAAIRMLVTMAAIGLAAGALAAKTPPAIPAIDTIRITIEAPGTGRDVEKSASVVAVLEFNTEDATSFPVVPAPAVLTDYDFSSKNMEIASQEGGYVLNVKSGGKYKATLKYQAPVEFNDGQWVLKLAMPPNLKNSISLKLPEPRLDVQSEAAVVFKLNEKKNSTEVEAVLGPVATGVFTWRPKSRKTTLEETVFYSEVNTFVGLQAGVVDLTSLIRYQIAQGEIKELKVKIPAGMSVTAVNAPNLATWSFDPEKRLLDAILEKPASDDFTLSVVAQVACEGLPYSVTLGAMQTLDAARQRDAIAIAAPDTIQVRVDNIKGINPMNIEDFSPEAMTVAKGEGTRMRGAMGVRRAFRYNQPEEVSATIQTERVLSEIRVTESGALDIADERIVLATKLGIDVAKSGIFSLELGIPADFDVETLTGRDVSHWDEVKENGRGIVVYFNKQIADATEINLVIARTEKGIEEKIVVPRVVVKDAAKHTGKLTVSGERGVRIMVDEHSGVDIKKASDEGIKQAGVLVFDILRPTWCMVLKTEVMAPQIKPEVLQSVDLTEGMLQCRAYIQYKIENAGVKSFRVKSPVAGVTLSVMGRNIARVAETDKEKGIWQVDLHNKVEDAFAMTVSYQVPYNYADQKVRILPLQTVDAEEQRGYLVVTCAGRVQIEPKGNLTGLKAEDPRNIPPMFGAGDLSGAIQCYRTIRPDYQLELSVVRHDSASVLPASIDHVRMISSMSTSGKLLTRAILQMRVGNMRLLKVALPNADNTLWTALVNGKEVVTWREGNLYCVPLEDQAVDTIVDMVYAGSPSMGRLFGMRRKYEAPKFIRPPLSDKDTKPVALPLNDIEWDFYALPNMEYFGFGGTMEHFDEPAVPQQPFNPDRYEQWNRSWTANNLRLAKDGLDKGQNYIKAGKLNVAKKEFQQALNYSQGQADVNEDARVQLRSLQKQQVKIGLVNRRDNVRFNNNIMDEQQLEQMQGFNGGNYSPEYANNVEKRLSEKDNDALDVVADKVIAQQAAAAGVITAINVTMPEHGRLLRFKRAMQIDPKGDLTVKFRTTSGRFTDIIEALAMAAVLFLMFLAMAARMRSKAA